jgi:streptogramin lyase
MRLLLLLFCLGASTAVQAQNSGAFATFDLASEAMLNDPHDLAFGPDGNLYVADKFGARIVVFDPDTLHVIDVLGEGLYPGVHDISFGKDGAIAVAVTGAGRVYLFASVDELSSLPTKVIAASQTEGALAHSTGRIYAMASGIGALGVFDDDVMLSFANGHVGAHDVAEAPDGTIWLADSSSRRLVHYTADLVHIGTLDHPKFGFIGPRYLDIDDFGNLIVADQDAHRVLMIDPTGPDGGTLLGVIGDGSPGIGPGKFDDPEGVAVRGNQYFVFDSDNNRIVRYSVFLN